MLDDKHYHESINEYEVSILFWVLVAVISHGGCLVILGAEHQRPNIVFFMADDWSYPHAGILGDPVVKTPHFDRVAREGVLFENAFVSTPSCTPSRLSVLTGQHHWRLKEGASLGGSLREEYDVYTERLGDAGYLMGRYGKGVWPSKHSFRERDSFGERYRTFEAFIEERKEDEPFCFWFGGQDPHRPYELGVGKKSGIDVDAILPPPVLPNNETVRSDLADYYWEVQRFDKQVEEVMAQLEAMGELDNTIVVVSGDNGMPFPRSKATLYDLGIRVPLAVRWGSKVKGNRMIQDVVSLCDLAPTFLEAAGLRPSKNMTGISILPHLLSDKSGQVDPERTFVLTGIEQHVYQNPCRALRTMDFLYIRNFNPENWKTGVEESFEQEHDFSATPWPTPSGAFSHNIDPSPSKQYLRLHRDKPEVKEIAALSFGRRSEEELYDLKKDPDQLTNLAEDPAYQNIRNQLGRQLNAELLKSNDPRMEVDGYTTQIIKGWVVRVSDELRKEKPQETAKALDLLKDQCQKVIDVIPSATVAHLQHVQLWVSMPTEDRRPRAEFHPSKDWLIEHGMHPEKAKGVEFTNTAIFAKEIIRMPMLLLHELAHAYHNLVVSIVQNFSGSMSRQKKMAPTKRWHAAIENHKRRMLLPM